MGKRLEGKVAIVTGATSGIGEAVAKRFAKEGAQVVFAARRLDKGKELEAGIRAEGGDAAFVQTDVSKAEDLKNLAAKAIELYGKIDILVNNAGIIRDYPFTEMDIEKDYDEIFNVNVKSYFLLCKEVVPHMLANGGGSIVNTSSLGAELGIPFHTSYAATKGAVRQFTKSLAVEYAEQGIRVNAMLPGLTITEMIPADGEFVNMMIPTIPMKRAAMPEEIANGFLFLASDESSFCTGTLLIMDGGASSF